eukprot:m.218194 g.218194  ORF g.218194 m.218194 type:complete len:572 (-) comp19143_c0_seq3:165-1880(-)
MSKVLLLVVFHLSLSIAGALVTTERRHLLGADKVFIIDIQGASLQEQIAVGACVGLANRNTSMIGAAYTVAGDRDIQWFDDTQSQATNVSVTIPAFLKICLNGGNGMLSATLANGYIRYNATGQKEILPNIFTLAGVLDAIPLEDGSPYIGGARQVFDAVSKFAGFRSLEATEYMWLHHVNDTTTMSKTNPGYQDQNKKPFNPPLTGEINPGLIDFVVKERLFNFYLNLGCIPDTDEYALEEKIVLNNPWPRPIAVFGYENSFPIAGDFFEAETDCNKVHNMGQVASDGCSNLAYFSAQPPITTPLQQVDQHVDEFVYNASKTYVSIIIGDGDNINYIKGGRRDWMLQRVDACTVAKKGCFPLVWSMSPHTLKIAPAWVRWYYEQANRTGNDFFCLPPSGDLYSYPGAMPLKDQQSFVANTERDAMLLNTSGSVHWEFTGGWDRAIENFFPLYATRNVVKGLFPVNVPFMIPIAAFGADEHYKIIADRVVLFKPQEWRGTTCTGAAQCPSAAQMAARLSNFPRGTVTNIYVTSDGGGNLQMLYDMVDALDAHVELVNQEVVVRAALSRGTA